jgi:neuromedin U receptor 1
MKRIACRNILIIWILSLVAATPLTVFTQINHLYINEQPLEESAWCGLPFNAPNRVWENFMIMSTVAFFIIPLIVITLLYSLIGRTLRKASRIPNPDFQLTDQSSSRKIMKSRTIVVRLLGEFPEIILKELLSLPKHSS